MATIESVDVTIELVPQRCGECGVVFGMEREHRKKLVEGNGMFYCPNGHCRCFTGKSESQKLRDELTATKARLDQAKADAEWQRQRVEAEQRSTAAMKGQLTKMRNRIDAGVCPCCNRTFANLHQHMQTQHADDPKAREAMVERMKSEKNHATGAAPMAEARRNKSPA